MFYILDPISLMHLFCLQTPLFSSLLTSISYNFDLNFIWFPRHLSCMSSVSLGLQLLSNINISPQYIELINMYIP